MVLGSSATCILHIGGQWPKVKSSCHAVHKILIWLSLTISTERCTKNVYPNAR